VYADAGLVRGASQIRVPTAFHKAASLCSSIRVDQNQFGDMGVCLQLSPTQTRDLLGIKGAELQALATRNTVHPAGNCMLTPSRCCVRRLCDSLRWLPQRWERKGSGQEDAAR
jgi:hypothetical protein